MFQVFKITTGEIQKLISDHTVDTNYAQLYENLAKRVRTTLTAKNVEAHYHDGSRLQEDWFPNNIGPFHIFISHSSKDAKVVKQFAKWLKLHLNLDCFVDSVYWEYSDNLLMKLDIAWCRYWSKQSRRYLYYYNKRNFTTANVHCMLSMALMKMMNSCECVILIDSDNSLRYRRGESVEKTPSPWIYEEIEMANMLPHIVPDRLKKKRQLNERLLIKAFAAGTEALEPIYYKAVTKDFPSVTANIFKKAESDSFGKASEDKPSTALDSIYENLGIIQKHTD